MTTMLHTSNVLALFFALASASSCEDPVKCRVIITSDSIYALTRENFQNAPTSSAPITMRYDLSYDPVMKNSINEWNGGYDIYFKTAYDYTRADGPLGRYGPLGPNGVLGSESNLPNRFHGTVPNNPNNESSYWNNWCPVADEANDSACVYGSYGPLGTSGPLNPYSYFNTMYHLNEYKYWYNDYCHNLDSSGVWAIQGPLGPTGALAVLGALGPLGISYQYGVTTTDDGIYMVQAKSDNTLITVRQTQPIRYEHDASQYRIYDLYEMYSKSYALSMTDNDCSFAVDAASSPADSKGDTYYFSSSSSQWVSLNVVAADMGTDYSLLLECRRDKSYVTVSTAASNPYSSNRGLEDFIVTRLEQEECRATVKLQYTENKTPAGYYFYVTGSALISVTNGKENVEDLWGLRQQATGERTYNILGPHQTWIPF